MDKHKIKYTVAFQLVCLSIILWVLAASGTPTEAKVAQQAATPEPFLGPIYYGREDVSFIFDHDLPIERMITRMFFIMMEHFMWL